VADIRGRGGGHPSNNFRLAKLWHWFLKPFDFCSKSSDFDEKMLEYQYLLLSIKSSDEPMYSLCCRRTLSDVLEGVTPNFILGASPQTRHCLSLRLHALMAIAFKPLCILPSTGDGTCLGSHEAFTPPLYKKCPNVRHCYRVIYSSIISPSYSKYSI